MAAAKIIANTGISFQLVLPRLPNVQNTIAPSFVSSAKYWSNVLAPAKRELSAVPARISPPGPIFFFNCDIPIIFDIADNLGEKATKNITDVINNSQIFYTRIELKDNVERKLKIIK